ncbi:hypothetical protein ACS0TY_022151 [Phlomoides rotata]
MAELKQHHAQIIKLGLSSDNDVVGRVVKFCSLSQSVDLNYALKGAEFKFSFPPIIRACSVDGAIEEAKQVHAQVIKHGFAQDSYCQNNLIHMYLRFNCLEEAKRVFDNLEKKDDVSWTTMMKLWVFSS